MDRNDPKFQDKTFVALTELVAGSNLAFWQAILALGIRDGSNEFEYYHELLEEWFGRKE